VRRHSSVQRLEADSDGWVVQLDAELSGSCLNEVMDSVDTDCMLGNVVTPGLLLVRTLSNMINWISSNITLQIKIN
jgi:hypothetical protein